jgi:Leucine-rich repeat (LRR) protein
LTDLVAVHTLTLHDVKRVPPLPPNLTELTLEGPVEGGLRHLADCRSLRSLTLKAFSPVVGALPTLPALEELSLNRADLAALESLDRHHRLRNLTLRKVTAQELDILEDLPRLTELDLNLAKDPPKLPLLPRLRSLRLSGAQPATLDRVGRMRDLETLAVGIGPKTDVTPLAALPRLRHLIVWTSGPLDVSVLVRLRGLRTLRIDGPTTASIDALAALPNLEEVEFSYGTRVGLDALRKKRPDLKIR